MIDEAEECHSFETDELSEGFEMSKNFMENFDISPPTADILCEELNHSDTDKEDDS